MKGVVSRDPRAPSCLVRTVAATMERGRPDAAPERVLAAMVQQAPASSCGMQPGHLLAAKIQTAAPYRSALSAHQAHLCWGAQPCKTDRCPLVVPKSPAFRDRFCAACREGPIIVPCCRIRVLDSSLPAPKNSRAEGMWNLEGRTNPPFWPPHRVINQTADTCGLRLIVLRDETSAPLQGLAPPPRFTRRVWLRDRVSRPEDPRPGPDAWHARAAHPRAARHGPERHARKQRQRFGRRPFELASALRLERGRVSW